MGMWRVAFALVGLIAAGCAPRRQEPPPARATRWGFGVDDLARVEALSGAGKVRLPVPQRLWAEIVTALDSAKEAEEPGPAGPRSPVLRFALKRGAELTLDLLGREHWRLVRKDGETPLAPCPALKAVCGVALRLACAAGADEIVVAKVTDGSGLEVVRTLKGSAAGRLTVEGEPLPSPGGPDALCVAFLRAESDGVGTTRYHRLLPVGTLWEHSEGMEAKLRESIPLPEKWGRAVGGLRLGLRARETETDAGGEVAIEVCIQNVGDKPIPLFQHRMGQYDYYPFTTFAATLPGGGNCVLAKPITMMKDIDRPRPRTLLPGEAYIHTVRLNHWGAFNQPGLYEIACTYSVKPADDSKGCWSGILKSPAARVHVRPRRTWESDPGGFI
ncbi:MAG: hypothetical protein FJ290_22830 [Planctomycetes bacterium]|nr:hypothetical protein [Planctomycetota bacterium]